MERVNAEFLLYSNKSVSNLKITGKSRTVNLVVPIAYVSKCLPGQSMIISEPDDEEGATPDFASPFLTT